MLFTQFLSLCVAAATNGSADETSRPQDLEPSSNVPGVVGLGFKAVKTTLDRTGRLNRLRQRDDTVALDVSNQLTMYQVTIKVGTPGQDQTVILDTGSSDLWVMDASNPYCGTSANGVSISCSQTFDNKSSSSFSLNDTDFYIKYGDGTVASGSFAQDTISINGNDISKGNFAVATEANSSFPVFGIGPRYGESTASTVTQSGIVQPTYDNILIQMKNQGLISSLSFSLWLNSIDATDGQVLFGGVDHAKYSNSLVSMPILLSLPGENIQLMEATSVNVQMTGLGLYNGQGDSGLVASGGVPVLLDSGTSLTYLPDEWLAALGNGLGASFSDALGMYIVECDIEGGIVFELAGTQFQIPFTQALFPLTSGTSSATDQNGNAVCGLGFTNSGPYSGDGTFILGETFLRGVYVTYDYENWEVAIAPANFNTTDSRVEAIGSSIPSVTSASSYSNTAFVSSFASSSLSLFSTSDALNSGATFQAETSNGAPGAATSAHHSQATADASGSNGGSASGAASGAGSSGSSGSNSSKNSAPRNNSPWWLLVCIVNLI